MDSKRYQEIRRIVHAAAAMQGSEREQYLIKNCPDAAFREEVRSYLLEVIAAGNGTVEDVLKRSLSDIAEAWVPKRVEDCEILERLGGGGMGVVFLAKQLSTDREVAVKFIRPDKLDASTRARFQREARALGQLQHPGIARIYHSGIAETAFGQVAYLVMELVRGLPVTDYAARKRLSLDEKVELLARIAEAIGYAHGKKIVHRDIKPDNVLVKEEGEPVVLDFGVAKLLGDNQGARLTAKAVIGTPQYMSPEQARGENDSLREPSDVYALGVLGYELLTGRPPYELAGLSLAKMEETIVERLPRRPSEVNPSLKGDLEAVLLKALFKEPERRFASAAELAADLWRYLKKEPVLARPPSTVYYLQKFCERNKFATAAGLATLVFLVVAVVSWVAAARANRALERALASEKSEREKATTALQELATTSTVRGYAGATLRYVEEVIRARRAQGQDTMDLELKEVEALMALGRDQEAQEKLDALGTTGQSSKIAGKILLYKGDLLLARSGPLSDEIGPALALIAEAAKHELEPVDAHYARALLATTVPEAVQELEATLREAPYHPRANKALCLLSILNGNIQRGLDLTRMMQAISPGDVSSGLFQAFMYYFLGDENAARAARARVVAYQNEEQREAVDRAFDALEKILNMAWTAGPKTPGQALDLQAALATVIDCANAFAELAALGQELEASGGEYSGAPSMPFPPVVLEVFRLAAGGVFALAIGQREAGQAGLTRLVEINPCGMTYAIRGFLTAESDPRAAERDLTHVLEIGGILPLVNEAFLFKLAWLRCQLYEDAVQRGAEAQEIERWRTSAREALAMALTQERVDPRGCELGARTAWKIKEHELLATAIYRWREAEPDNPMILYTQAWHAFNIRAYGAAIDYALQFLQARGSLPPYYDIEYIQENALRLLQEEAARYPVPKGEVHR